MLVQVWCNSSLRLSQKRFRTMLVLSAPKNPIRKLKTFFSQRVLMRASPLQTFRNALKTKSSFERTVWVAQGEGGES